MLGRLQRLRGNGVVMALLLQLLDISFREKKDKASAIGTVDRSKALVSPVFSYQSLNLSYLVVHEEFRSLIRFLGGHTFSSLSFISSKESRGLLSTPNRNSVECFYNFQPQFPEAENLQQLKIHFSLDDSK